MSNTTLTRLLPVNRVMLWYYSSLQLQCSTINLTENEQHTGYLFLTQSFNIYVIIVLKPHSLGIRFILQIYVPGIFLMRNSYLVISTAALILISWKKAHCLLHQTAQHHLWTDFIGWSLAWDKRGCGKIYMYNH